MTELYTAELVYDMYHAPAHLAAYVIPPGGWLSAILVKKMGTASDIRFELTDNNHDALYADFTLYSMLWCGGVQLKEPIPNVNVTQPYILKILDDAPELEIITVNRMIAR
jgi:hypothetical protein